MTPQDAHATSGQRGWLAADGTRDETSPLPEQWVMAASDSTPLGQAIEAFIALDAPPDEERDAAVRSLRVRGDIGAYVTEVPRRLDRFPNLTELSLGAGVAPTIVSTMTDGAIPDTVTTLEVWTGGAPTRWPRGMVLPSVRRLQTDGPTTFTAQTFPNLEHAHLAPTKTSFEALLALPRLAALQLRTVPHPAPEIFEKIAHLPLVDLGLLGGRKITDLRGIELLPGLRRLRLQSLPVLTSIAALEGLEHLEELLILYCSRIEDIETVTKISSLGRFDAYGCTGIGLEALESFLDEHSAHRTHRRPETSTA